MSFKIAIDAGHGVYTPGKRCLSSIDTNETREWDLNSRIAEKLQDLLSLYDVQILRVDDTTGSIDVALSERCNMANFANVDLYLSIHHNAGANGSTSGGLEVYRHVSCSEIDETGLWQTAIYNSLIDAGVPKGNRAEPKKAADFQVLRSTKMSAILCEMGFMDSTVDTPIILSNEFADKGAKGLCDCLVARAGLIKSDVQTLGNAKAQLQVQSANEVTEPGTLAVSTESVEKLPYAVYQVYTKTNKWLPNVVDDSDYAGVKLKSIQGLYLNISEGSVEYQVHTVGKKWLPWVTDRTDYAGLLGKNVDAVRVKLAGNNDYSVQCRVAPIGSGYYPWVTDNNDYAGVLGKAIDRVQIRIIRK